MPDPIRKAVGATMLLAPLLGLVSAIASPALKSGSAAQLAEIARHPDRWYLYALFVTASMWLLVPAIVGLVGLVSERAPRLGLVGGALALLGALVAVGDATTELMYWQMGAPSADPAQMAALADRYESAAGSSLVFAVGGLAIVVGLALLAAALWRQRVAPAWAAAAVPVGVVVNIAGFSVNSNGVVLASNLVLVAGLGWVGHRLLVSPTTPAGRPALSPG
jgi:hypothetical protein